MRLIDKLEQAMQSLTIPPEVMVLNPDTLQAMEDEIDADDYLDSLDALLVSWLPEPVTIATSRNMPEGELIFL